ncbi:MAG: NAD(+) kinase [Deltaproteobacteria bacterium]|nr:MAG: NAD(+) kinase [Deltaproteobacteria bacterium]
MSAPRRKRKAAPSRPSVLVVYKKSAYQRLVIEKKNRRVQRLLADGDQAVSRIRDAHDSHVGTVEEARAILKQLGVRATYRHLSSLRRGFGAYDLVITLGGDGTLLGASHYVGQDVPMVAINTAPRDSVGYFCAGTRDDLETILSKALSGKLRATSLTRMEVELEGKVLSTRILNDALFSHSCPAATTRYFIRRDDLVEEHKSSGIWIGPAAGSTAAQRSAGGRVLPLRSEKLQYVVRELYEPHGENNLRLLKGLLAPGESLEIRSKTPTGRLYLDGPHRTHEVALGDMIHFRRSDDPLTLLGLHRRKK